MNTIHRTIFTIVPILAAGIFIFVFAMLLSPKLRGRMMARQIRATRYATDFAKKDMSRTAENLADSAIDAAENIMDDNGEKIEKMMHRVASMEAGMIRTVISDNKDSIDELVRTGAEYSAKVKAAEARAAAEAVKEVFREDEKTGRIFCKYCGAGIDEDSVFCSKCGKKL